MRVLLDVDGVIADFTSAVLDDVYCLTGKTFGPEDVTCWSIKEALGLSDEDWRLVVDYICDRGFARNLKPYPGAVQAVKQIAEAHDVYFVTSPWHSAPTWVHDRTDWLCKHFGQTQGRKVVHTSHKHLVDGDFLVDDKPETVWEWSKAWEKSRASFARVGILWSMPYNQQGSWKHRTNDWEELRRIIDG